jgi:hypothetical protein
MEQKVYQRFLLIIYKGISKRRRKRKKRERVARERGERREREEREKEWEKG